MHNVCVRNSYLNTVAPDLEFFIIQALEAQLLVHEFIDLWLVADRTSVVDNNATVLVGVTL